MSRKGKADVVIIGAGVIGCAIARELALRGLAVSVVERDSPGRRATWAAAGMLSPFGEGGRGAFLELADESLTRFAAFAHALHEETSIDVEYRTSGKLHVALGDIDDELRALAADPAARRFDATPVDGPRARALEPALSDEVTSGLMVGRDHRVNNRLLAQALLAAATAAGATFRTANPVAALSVRHGAVQGVRLGSGEHIEAPMVVVAAGAWSGALEGLPRVLPVRPVKGQMFSVDARGRTAERTTDAAIERVIFARDCYIIPRDDGRLLVGATQEDVGFRKGPTPRGIGTLMDAATRVLPGIADMPLVETWAGFRPATPDGLPILGPDPGTTGLVYATGHFRNGILLAPVTALCIAEMATGGRPPVPLDAFAITRFAR
ncbi:MAG TPA: glycine oxidase ThiO [Longimicrobiales bacterium]|nr:glycine oxidase ThiO [Longimicrobiales bacterium]